MQLNKATIDEFMNLDALMVFGMSRSGQKFGNHAYKELAKSNRTIYPVHNEAAEINGTKCWNSLKDIPENVKGAFISLPAPEAEKEIERLAQKGVTHVWIQRGGESEKVIQLCEEKGIKVIYGACLLMFLEPVNSVHKFHRFIWGLFNTFEN